MSASSGTPLPCRIMVTGASAGIGHAIVELLARRGHWLHAIARCERRLAALARETGCSFDAVDIRDTARMQDVINAVKPDVLVNNAGTSGAFGMLAATPETMAETVEVNLTAALRVTRMALKHMLAAGRGQIVTIGSISGLHPTASTVYGATKGALHLMMQALRVELSGSGVRVTEICPGLVDTGLVPDSLRKIANRIKMLAPHDVADAVRYAIEAPAHVNISLLELTPIEQAVGGLLFKPVTDDRFK